MSGEGSVESVEFAPGRYAALIAPVIERLTFAVVRPAMARSSDLVARYQTTPDVIQMLAQLRTGLAGREVTPAGLAAVYRYHPPVDVERRLAALVDTGLVAMADGAAVRATEAGQQVLAQMYRTAAEITAELWADRSDTLPALNRLAGSLVVAGLASGDTAFATMAPPHEPPEAPIGLLLHHRLQVMRYHRADAHATAWQAAGLTLEEIQAMPPGPAREAIEEDTNRRAGVPFAVLTPEERLGLLAGLAALPG